jgi:hypothetical protein
MQFFQIFSVESENMEPIDVENCQYSTLPSQTLAK